MVDIWPRDRASRCWADMTRTFVAGGGAPDDELRRVLGLTQESLDRVYAEVRAGADGRDDLHAAPASRYIAAGKPTQLTKQPGEVLRDGYFHGARPRRRAGDPRAPRPRPLADDAASPAT